MIQLRTILATFINPKKAFLALLDRPRALAAILLLIAVGWAVNATISSRIDLEAQVRLTAEELASEPGKKVSETEIKKEAIRTLNVRRIIGYIQVVFLWPVEGRGLALGFPVITLLLAFLFWLPSRFSKQRIPFKTSFSIAAHLWLPIGLRLLLSIPVILTYPSLDPMHLSGLFKTDLSSVVQFQGASLFDPFLIWTAVLFALAGRTVGWKAGTYLVAGAVLWLLLGGVFRMQV